MAESNDNWECIGKVDFFWYGYQSVDLYVKYVNGVPFYKVWESVVYKSIGEHNAYVKAEKNRGNICFDVPTWDRME